eukprot:8280610-Pyramimonas_sp.AAC.1
MGAARRPMDGLRLERRGQTVLSAWGRPRLRKARLLVGQERLRHPRLICSRRGVPWLTATQ